MSQTILRAEDIVKTFFGNCVLDHVQLDLRVGRVHALCGENGAGKSTLLKIITGIYTKDSGRILMDGQEITINSVADAKRHGIHVVPQEMQILGNLTVAENIFLSERPCTRTGRIDWKRMFSRAEEVKRSLGKAAERIDVRAKAGSLSMGAWQMIEIMRAVAAEMCACSLLTSRPPRCRKVRSRCSLTSFATCASAGSRSCTSAIN